MKPWLALAALLPLLMLTACDRGKESAAPATTEPRASTGGAALSSGGGQAGSSTASGTPETKAAAKADQGKASAAGSSGSSGEYTVAAGDTLSGIAREHGLRTQDLARWNNIDDPNRIREGQKLKLSGPDS